MTMLYTFFILITAPVPQQLDVAGRFGVDVALQQRAVALLQRRARRLLQVRAVKRHVHSWSV